MLGRARGQVNRAGAEPSTGVGVCESIIWVAGALCAGPAVLPISLRIFARGTCRKPGSCICATFAGTFKAQSRRPGLRQPAKASRRHGKLRGVCATPTFVFGAPWPGRAPSAATAFRDVHGVAGLLAGAISLSRSRSSTIRPCASGSKAGTKRAPQTISSCR